MKTIKCESRDTTYFNDLAIDKKGNCYITDSDSHKLYFFNSETEEISVFFENPRIMYPNGVAISDDGNKLFVDSYTTGIKVIDLKRKLILNEDHPATSRKGIDGLKYHNSSLYYVQNGGKNKKTHGLYRAELTKDETAIGEPIPLLLNHKLMNLPTTIFHSGSRGLHTRKQSIKQIESRRTKNNKSG